MCACALPPPPSVRERTNFLLLLLVRQCAVCDNFGRIPPPPPTWCVPSPLPATDPATARGVLLVRVLCVKKKKKRRRRRSAEESLATWIFRGKCLFACRPRRAEAVSYSNTEFRRSWAARSVCLSVCLSVCPPPPPPGVGVGGGGGKEAAGEAFQ